MLLLKLLMSTENKRKRKHGHSHREKVESLRQKCKRKWITFCILTAKLIIKSYIQEIKHVNGISLSEIRELIQDNERITIHKKQIKSTKN